MLLNCSYLCRHFSNLTGSWVMLCFYTPITFPKLFNLFLIRCYVHVAWFCLKAPVKLPLIICSVCSLGSCLWTVWCFVLQSSITMLKLSLKILYSFSSLFLIPSSHGLFRHSTILLMLPLSLSTFLNSYSLAQTAD